MRSNRAWLAAALLTIVAPAATSRADVLHATRRQAMQEVSHTVDIFIADGVATYKVRRMFANPGKVADQVELQIGLPYGAAATGLRIRAKERWYDGVLLEKSKAEALYREMTGYGSATAKDPALLGWMWADKLSLQIFPVMAGGVSTVEYTLTAPTGYDNGRYVVSYPRTDVIAENERDPHDLALALPIVTVHPSWGDTATAITVDGTRVVRDTPVALVPPEVDDVLSALATEPNASYVASAIVVPPSAAANEEIKSVTVDFAISHTYRSDLQVELLTPNGLRVPLVAQQGGSENGLRGSSPVTLPAGQKGAGTWRLVVSDHAALDTGTLDTWTLSFGADKQAVVASAQDLPLFVPDAPESASEAGVATITIAPPTFAPWQARFGRAVASSAHVFARLEVDVAPQLSPLPKAAQVVFVVDASHSMEARGITAQLDLIAAYVSHVPDAVVEIVTFRRHATRVFGRFVRVQDLPDAIAVAKMHGAFTPGNGSALDEGAQLAAATLADRPGDRRLVVFSDELVRDALTPVLAQATLARLSPQTVVHVVVPDLDESDRPALARHDDAALAALATKHHGIYASISGFPAASQKPIIPIALELVRPTRIEKVTATGFLLDEPTLHEGQGVRLMVDAPKHPGRVTLAGFLWSDPVKKELAPAALFSSQTAAFVFGADMHQDLTPTEQYTLAMFGHAVSPVTSYVAWEPGVRPSTDGFLESGFGSGLSGFGAGGGGIGMALGRIKPAFPVSTAACVAKLGPAAGWTATVRVETTKDEVVDVRGNLRDPMTSCVAETIWAMRIDPAIYNLAHETFEVTVGDGVK